MSLPSLFNCSVNGVFTLLSICAAVKTLPFSVASPMRVTRKMPCPSITFVPRRTKLVGKVASASNSSGLVLFLQMGSPVSEDSSTLNTTAERSSPSAGIFAPVLSRTMSPTTISRFGMFVGLPSLITSTSSSSSTWFSMAKALFALSSKKNAKPVASKIAMKIPTGSKKTFVPSLRPKYS